MANGVVAARPATPVPRQHSAPVVTALSLHPHLATAADAVADRTRRRTASSTSIMPDHSARAALTEAEGRNARGPSVTSRSVHSTGTAAPSGSPSTGSSS